MPSFFKDIDPEDIDKLLKAEIPPYSARAGWSIDAMLLGEVIESMGLKHKVKIRYSSGRRRTGTHYAKFDMDEGFWHRIVLSQNESAEDANQTLWHELRHAMQAEIYAEQTMTNIRAFDDVYDEGKGEWGETYKGNVWEIDARRFAENNEHIKLIK